MQRLWVVSMRVIYYTASWCHPCQSFKPVVEIVASEFDLKVEYVDIETNPAYLSGEEQVKGIPTLVFIKDGKRVGSLTGAYPEPMFRQKVREFLG